MGIVDQITGVKVAVAANVVVRAVMRDDAAQARMATKLLTDSTFIAVALL